MIAQVTDLGNRKIKIANTAHIQKLKTRLYDELGYTLKIPESYDEDMSAAKYIIIYNGAHEQKFNFLKKYRKNQLILAVLEPPCIINMIHEKAHTNKYAKVLTWRDDLINNTTHFKLYLPRCQRTMIKTMPAFKDKKLCTIISKCRRPTLINTDLFPQRVSSIRYFDSLTTQEFDLFGEGWEKYNFSCYKGPVGSWNHRESKIEVIKNYKFYLCYENCYIPGYISEKIFDCFQAGVVPIYWGATNITDYIPTNCFIDRRSFKDMDALYTYIKNIDEQTYNEYIYNIKTYLESDLAKLYSADAFADSVIECIKGGSK